MKIVELYAKYGDEAAKYCAGYLKSVLSAIAPNDWWETMILAKLYDDQKRDIGNTIETLDLALLLTVFEINYNEIAANIGKSGKKLRRQDRSIVYEMKNYRNNSAHFPPEGLSVENIYRDFDTLWRFLELVGADAKKVQEVKDINNRGFKTGYEENSLNSIINSAQGLPENPKAQAAEKKRKVNPKDESSGDYAYIISSNGIRLFYCKTFEEVKYRILNYEISPDYNIFEVDSNMDSPGPEIGSISGFAIFFEEREIKSKRKKIITPIVIAGIIGFLYLLISTGWWLPLLVVIVLIIYLIFFKD